MHQYLERDGEEYRKPGVKDGKCGIKGGGRTGEDEVEE